MMAPRLAGGASGLPAKAGSALESQDTSLDGPHD